MARQNGFENGAENFNRLLGDRSQERGISSNEVRNLQVGSKEIAEVRNSRTSVEAASSHLPKGLEIIDGAQKRCDIYYEKTPEKTHKENPKGAEFKEKRCEVKPSQGKEDRYTEYHYVDGKLEMRTKQRKDGSWEIEGEPDPKRRSDSYYHKSPSESPPNPAEPKSFGNLQKRDTVEKRSGNDKSCQYDYSNGKVQRRICRTPGQPNGTSTEYYY